MKLTIKNYQKLEDYKHCSIDIKETPHSYEIGIYAGLGFYQKFILGRTAHTVMGDIRYELYSKRTKESKWISKGTINDIQKFINALNHFKDIPFWETNYKRDYQKGKTLMVKKLKINGYEKNRCRFKKQRWKKPIPNTVF